MKKNANSNIASRNGAQVWLIKFAPFRTSWTDIVRRGTFTLRGIRNPEARNNLAAMRKNDLVLFYHSQRERAIVGILTVTRTAYPDPTTADSRWLTCDFKPFRSLPRPVALAEMKKNPHFEDCPLIRRPRLSVMPISQSHYSRLLEMTGTSMPDSACKKIEGIS
jgi:predicted RNA-binding protein with PUA-like domain